ncbi:GNAT family N-acetyltransferase [Microbacterium nymphoidis]|uniref:GNAT family N-acetyltransferase n=1 Tax=Microbacterium nymphoidis TaxID=2898586 RepID=UPI001E37E49E|nr:GNAT family N-acetyltransferase [Microbacterium nymphoidis]MCD2496885.1 GNAT family N-acetyltransferase [Microbacterium nymphoidis]
MKDHSIVVIAHEKLTSDELGELQQLFDSEYRDEFGEWRPQLPYGYAPHDVHIIAQVDGRAVGHVGWARREIVVGTQTVVIAGVGGVLIAEGARGRHLGFDLMREAERTMRAHGGIDFGYLGCREDVVPFYAACGWTRVHAAERSIGRAGELVADPPGQPILIFPLCEPTESWPEGEIDLRGRAW